ncbi:MAG: amino acid permease [Gemmatimonadetes bacterium]|nr:amino acid permease [Gemmatimonadota bacterium]
MDTTAPHLRRQLGIWSGAAILVGITIGSGIFRVPSSVAASTGSVTGIVVVWVTGAVVVLLGALTMAELATMYPLSGGIYVFLRETYGPRVAFLFGWTELVVIRPSALGAIAMIFAEYVGDFVHLSPVGVRVVAAAAIITVGLVNIRSVRWGAVLENTTTGAKILALSLLAVAALALAAGGAAAAQPAAEAVARGSWSGWGLALVSALWAYDGWADLTFMSGEVENPGRTLPRALILGVLVVVGVYLLLNATYFLVLGVNAMAASPLVAADVARRLTGTAGSHVVSALVILSTFGSLNGSMMTGPRIFFAMAEDGMMWRPVAAVHPRHGTPWGALALATVLGVGYVSVQTFEQLADGFILGIWPFYALAVGAVILLRRRRPDAERAYRTPGYPWVPLVFLAASVGMLLSALVQQPRSTLIGFGIIAAGIPVYALVVRGRRRAGGRHT